MGLTPGGYGCPMLRDSHVKTGHDVALSTPPQHRAKGKKRPARAVIERPPQPLGWNTTDSDEIALRQWRGRTEIFDLEALEPRQPVLGTFRVRSDSGGQYDVEVRSLDEHVNSCGCMDHRVNGLGTCKHIEGVIALLQRRHATAVKKAAAAGRTRVEVFIDRRQTLRPAIIWPPGDQTRAVLDWLRPFLKPDGSLTTAPAKIAALVAAWPSAPAKVRRALRVSRHFGPWIERERRERSRAKSRTKFLADVERGTASFDLVRHPLLPYQREGMMHLAFGERALLADEMGLGKTVQAIAACELLARSKGISRILVVCPASLKAEWEEQIARFTERGAKSVFGPRAQRLAAYAEPAFFNIVNYEQVLADAGDINAILAPEVVILDEAQRIKNWQTKTAHKVKQLRSPYAFVLTGTPLENRIDELYSIVQYLDPELVGPLFRFNRQFYALDERGRPDGYKNLAGLRDLVAPVMLRRRKADVENELPGRTVTNYLVPMVAEQRARYDDYSANAARIVQIAQRRPLLPKEFERLQMLLACMRMICDTPAILDPTCRVCPKLEELERILGDLLAEPGSKVIIFSEWERMLGMVRELAGEMGIEVAWHTGSVPQQRRRAEINRFKGDPACRLFLSTDSGSVGLNLQAANAVINCDLPWNPAKLEQRIARAWRKGQMRSVTVVNLVCEDSIEHNMVHLLGAKQALADGVLDGQGDLSELRMPSGRAAMVERMQALMAATQVPQAAPMADAAAAAPALPVTPSLDDIVVGDLKQRHGENALLVESRQGSDGRFVILAVCDLDRAALRAEATRSAASDTIAPVVEMIDRETWQTLCRLQASGIIQFAQGPARVLHRALGLADTEAEDVTNAARARAAKLRELAGRALRVARVLAAGGFCDEARPQLAQAVMYGGAVKLALSGELAASATTATPAQVRRLVERGAIKVAAETLDVVFASEIGPAGFDIDHHLEMIEHALEEPA